MGARAAGADARRARMKKAGRMKPIPASNPAQPPQWRFLDPPTVGLSRQALEQPLHARRDGGGAMR
jgi:hypothetical protein